MPELCATMTKYWENQFVSVKPVGKVMDVIANQHQSVVAMFNVEITLFVSMEFAVANRDSRETFQTCKRFVRNLRSSIIYYSYYCPVVFLDRAVEQFALKMLNAR